MKNEHTKIISEKFPLLFSPLQLGDVRLAHRVEHHERQERGHDDERGAGQMARRDPTPRRSTGEVVVHEEDAVAARPLGGDRHRTGTHGIGRVDE